MFGHHSPVHFKTLPTLHNKASLKHLAMTPWAGGSWPLNFSCLSRNVSIPRTFCFPASECFFLYSVLLSSWHLRFAHWHVLRSDPGFGRIYQMNVTSWTSVCMCVQMCVCVCVGLVLLSAALQRCLFFLHLSSILSCDTFCVFGAEQTAALTSGKALLKTFNWLKTLSYLPFCRKTHTHTATLQPWLLLCADNSLVLCEMWCDVRRMINTRVCKTRRKTHKLSELWLSLYPLSCLSGY